MPIDTDGKRIFECRMCGTCCKGFGGTCITIGDTRRIAEYLQISETRLIEQYCLPSGDKFLISSKENDYCHFFDGAEKRCAIHPVKPRMCRDWPFLHSVLIDPDNWRIMAASCPGMRADPSDDIIQAHVRGYLNTKGFIRSSPEAPTPTSIPPRPQRKSRP